MKHIKFFILVITMLISGYSNASNLTANQDFFTVMDNATYTNVSSSVAIMEYSYSTKINFEYYFSDVSPEVENLLGYISVTPKVDKKTPVNVLA